MTRLLAFLADSRYRVIVSKGPQADLLDLPDNAWGEEVVLQPAILGGVDAVITHGGNNTVTESLHFGRPMVVLPLFWDQYDNAQLVDELGLGIRLDTYRCDREDLIGAIDRVLADHGAVRRLSRIATGLQSHPGRQLAADLIERVAETGRPVRRR